MNNNIIRFNKINGESLAASTALQFLLHKQLLNPWTSLLLQDYLDSYPDAVPLQAADRLFWLDFLLQILARPGFGRNLDCQQIRALLIQFSFSTSYLITVSDYVCLLHKAQNSW